MCSLRGIINAAAARGEIMRAAHHARYLEDDCALLYSNGAAEFNQFREASARVQFFLYTLAAIRLGSGYMLVSLTCCVLGVFAFSFSSLFIGVQTQSLIQMYMEMTV